MRRWAIRAIRGLLWIVVVAALLATIAPRFLDRLYHRGDPSGHFDGARFFNPDGEDTAGPPTGGSRAGFFWRYFIAGDARPPWPALVPVRPARGAELAPLPPARPGAPQPMRATWIGHATVLVQLPGLNILTDPVWSDTAGPFGLGPHRVAAPGIAFADLPPIDLVLLSHNHYDHFDLGTLKRLWARDRPQIATSLGNDAILRDAGIPSADAGGRGVIALDWGQRHPVRGRAGSPPASVVATRNHHWGSRWFADRNRALWSSFVVTLPDGNLFFAGDTGMGDGRWPAEAARLGPIRLALIPIGAFRFVPGQMASASHIGPFQAADVHRDLGASTSLPIHWGTFRLSYEQYRTPPLLLRAATRCLGQPGFTPVAIGRPIAIAAYRVPVTPRTTRAAAVTCLNGPAVHALR